MRCAAALVIALLAAALPGPAAAEEAPGKDVVIKTLPGIVVDTKAREVRLQGTVCLQQGALELFVCGEHSREHESVVVVKAKPSHVTFALSLLGLPPGKPGFVTEGGAFSPPAGEVLDITARFKDKDGKDVAVPAWKLLRVSGSQEGLDRPVEWVYVGRPEEEALRASDREGTVVCLSNFAEAVIDVPFESTSVNANLMYEANPAVVPPRGTAIELVIRPVGRRINPIKVEIEVVLKRDRPPELDGKPLELAALKDAVNAMPVAIRTVVLRADADERFGRVMEVHEILRGALMNVQMVVLAPKAPPPRRKEAAPAAMIVVTSDDKVRFGQQTLTVEEFRGKAKELLKGVERVNLSADARAAMKSVAEVMSIARDQGATVSLTHANDGK